MASFLKYLMVCSSAIVVTSAYLFLKRKMGKREKTLVSRMVAKEEPGPRSSQHAAK